MQIIFLIKILQKAKKLSPTHISIVKQHHVSNLICEGRGRKMGVQNFASLVANVGFPVVVSGYLLIRLEKQIIGLAASINKLNTIISTKLGVVIDKGDDNKMA